MISRRSHSSRSRSQSQGLQILVSLTSRRPGSLGPGSSPARGPGGHPTRRSAHLPVIYSLLTLDLVSPTRAWVSITQVSWACSDLLGNIVEFRLFEAIAQITGTLTNVSVISGPSTTRPPDLAQANVRRCRRGCGNRISQRSKYGIVACTA